MSRSLLLPRRVPRARCAGWLRLLFVVGTTSPSLGACAHDHAATGAGKPEMRASSAATVREPSPYIWGEMEGQNAEALVDLGRGTVGMIVGRERVVRAADDAFRRAAADASEELAGVLAAPPRLGGGFVFWTETALYRASSFDGHLVPLARVPSPIVNVTFGTKGLFVRGSDGQRWAFGLPDGARQALSPLGVISLVGADDGRALALDASGTVHVSLDGGEHWTPVAMPMASTPERVDLIGGAPWLFTNQGEALLLGSDGRLNEYRVPPDVAPVRGRALDPRWRGVESPLRTVFGDGVALGDGTALVVARGDLVRVDVRTGELASVAPGGLPPDATCQGLASPGDVLFACTSTGRPTEQAFVVSHTLGGGGPVVELTLAAGARFVASDEGGLAYDAPCSLRGAPSSLLIPTPSSSVACVRQTDGSWHDVDLGPSLSDGGAADLPSAVRWIPRADGSALALVRRRSGSNALFDSRAGTTVDLVGDFEIPEIAGKNILRHRVAKGKPLQLSSISGIDDTLTPLPGGGVRGLRFDVTPDGRVVRSPFELTVVASGRHALGRATDGRYYQSTDHGHSWAAVAGPPSEGSGVELRSCSSAGCDFGAYFRVGWPLDPPRASEPRKVANEPPLLARPARPAFACRVKGSPTQKVLAGSARSPDDFGLGASRLSLPSEDSEFVRGALLRRMIHPMHEATFDETMPSLRGMVSGPKLEWSGERLTFTSSDRAALGYERPLAFVAPFDPSSTYRRTSLPMREILAAGHGSGMTPDDVFFDDMTEAGDLLALTPLDPGGPGEIAFYNGRGLLAWTQRGKRAGLGLRSPTNDSASVISGVLLGDREAAFLEIESSGVEHVFKASGASMVDLFELGGAIPGALAPANPDALALSAHGDLAILRTSSGSEPASERDPAILLSPSQKPVALAPWSTLKTMDDPACAAKDGYRATLSLMAPWIRFTTVDLRTPKESMLVRVKWTPSAVCLEGFEVRVADVRVRAPGGGSGSTELPTWLVGRGSSYARVGLSEGVEWRQPLECALQPFTP